MRENHARARIWNAQLDALGMDCEDLSRKTGIVRRYSRLFPVTARHEKLPRARSVSRPSRLSGRFKLYRAGLE